MPGSFKTEGVVLRSIRFGEADRILHLYTAERGRVNAIAKGSRRPKSRFGGRLEPFFRLDLMLHEGRSDLCTVTGAATVDGYPHLRSDGLGDRCRRPRLRRGAAPARLGGAEPPRLQPALPLPGAARRGRAGGRRGRSRAHGPVGPRVPAQAGARGRVLTRARRLRPLRGARGDRLLLGGCRRRRLRIVRGAAASRSRRRGPPVHGRRDRPPDRGAAARRRRGRCVRSSARSATPSPIMPTSISAPSPEARVTASPAAGFEQRIRALEEAYLWEPATRSYPAHRLRARARQPGPHAVPARPRPDRALEGVPAPQAQDPGVHRARGRSLPDPAHPHPRDVLHRPDRRAGARPQRGPDRGDRARPRSRPSAVRPHRRGGPRRRPQGARRRPASVTTSTRCDWSSTSSGTATGST